MNNAVISDRGYLLGMVVEADPTSCKVMTILHPSFNAAGVVSRTRENGILNGNTTYAPDGLCTLTNLERSTETHAGDQVITTGLGGVFPPDLLVGTVQDVVPEASGKSSIAVVRPGAPPAPPSTFLSLLRTKEGTLLWNLAAGAAAASC